MSWYAWMLAGVLASVVVSVLLARSSTRTRRALLLVWGALALFSYPWLTLVEVMHGRWTLREGLPLHLCDLSSLVVGIVCVRAARFDTLPKARERVAEVCFYLGLGGGLAGIVLPQDTPADVTFVPFVVWHAALIGAPCVLVTHGLAPTLAGVGRSLLVICALAPFIALTDYAIDANYMFLRNTPKGAGAFLLAPPLHVITLIALAAVVMLAIWAPLAAIRRRPSR